MKRKLILAAACLAMVFALGGCSDKTTGSNGTPSATPSVTPSTGVNDGHQADENGNSNTTDPTDTPDTTDHLTDGSTGDAAGKTRTATRGTDANGDGILHDVGDAARDVADGTERAVRDIL